MANAKRKISISIDEDLVAELERGDQGLSARVNAVLRADLELRRRQRLLVGLLDRLDAGARWRSRPIRRLPPLVIPAKAGIHASPRPRRRGRGQRVRFLVRMGWCRERCPGAGPCSICHSAGE